MMQEESSPISHQEQLPTTQSITPLNNLEKFLANYNKFIQQNQTLQLHTSTILSDIAQNILQPPLSPQLQMLYSTAKQFPQLLASESPQMQDLISRVKRLKQDKIYQTVLYIQQLNYKLSKQYEFEVNRGIQLGVYNKKTISNGGSQNTQNTVNLQNKKYPSSSNQ